MYVAVKPSIGYFNMVQHIYAKIFHQLIFNTYCTTGTRAGASDTHTNFALKVCYQCANNRIA